MRLGNLVRSVVDDIIDTTEMVHRLHNIVHRRVLRGDTECVGLEDIPRLFLCQSVAFDMVGVVCQINLRTMIYTAF